jgi:hypothetical protein
MISVKEYNKTLFDEVLEFCKSQKDDSEVSNNMWVENWMYDSGTLLYILEANQRFANDTGVFHLLYDDDKIIGCGGVYISEFSPHVAIAGSRTWVDKKYRNFQYVKNYILVENKSWAIKKGVDVIALSFNYYNKNVIRLFMKGINIGSRTEKHIFYNNFNILDFPVIIQYTPQWVIYENLNDFRFDWATLRA